MLVLRLAHPNFYLLDEPTNHLDIEGQEALEDELMDASRQAACWCRTTAISCARSATASG